MVSVVGSKPVLFEAGEKSIELVKERGVVEGGCIVESFVVNDVLDALPRGTGFFSEVGLHLLLNFVLAVLMPLFRGTLAFL